MDKIIAANLSADCLHFIYPATPFPYKEHKTLVEAVRILRQSNPSVFAKIRIHFTIPIGGYPLLEQLIVAYGVSEQFVFDGIMSHENLLSFYKASRGLLFPVLSKRLDYRYWKLLLSGCLLLHPIWIMCMKF